MNRHDVITAGIDRLHIGTAGRLTFTDLPNVRHETLVSSSGDAGLLARDFILRAPTPDALLQKFVAHETPLVIAARISGTIESAFSTPPPPPAARRAEATASTQEGVPAPEHIRQTDKAQILVFADSDFFDDRFWVSEQIYQGQRFGVPIADNAKFLLNAVEHMMGSSALISLRGRQRIERPFTRVEDLRAQAQSHYRAQEEALLMRIEAATSQLDAIERGNAGVAAAYRASTNYRQELVAARKALRRVQADLNRDIDRLAAQVLWVNIATAPLLLLIGALLLAGSRRHRRRKTQNQTQNQT
ncbi:MAG: hypothetical protein HAW64_05840, partial [Alphaproteobacteria bacterium]|nr:hypothetical protein [Alphaproteobacteria bacterium]